MTRPTFSHATPSRSVLCGRPRVRDRPECQAERILSKAIEDGASQLVVASVDRDVPQMLLFRKAIALLTKPCGVPARASKPGDAESERSARGEDLLVAVLVFELECIGSEPNRFRRNALENIHRYRPGSRSLPPGFDAFAGSGTSRAFSRRSSRLT